MAIKKLEPVKDPTVQWISQHWQSGPVTGEKRPHFAFLSIPFDYAVSYRPGTRFGPESILEALDGYTLYCADKRVSIQDSVFHHLGAVEVVHSLPGTYTNIENAVSAVQPGYIPICLGGDHSITDPVIRGLQRRPGGENFGLLIFDTHFDFRVPIPGKEHSGCWLKTLEDCLDYSRVAILGIGASVYSEYYMKKVEELGVMIKTPYQIRKEGWASIRRQVMEHVSKNNEAVYYSIDIDSLDQAFAPATSAPNPNGLFPYEIMDTVFEISSAVPTMGMDITEVAPHYDSNNNFTAHVAANIIINFVAGVVKRGQQM